MLLDASVCRWWRSSEKRYISNVQTVYIYLLNVVPPVEVTNPIWNLYFEKLKVCVDVVEFMLKSVHLYRLKPSSIVNPV